MNSKQQNRTMIKAFRLFLAAALLAAALGVMPVPVAHAATTTENFETETAGNTTFSESGISFSITGDLVISVSEGLGCCPSNRYIDTGWEDGGTSGSAGKIQITTDGKAFNVLELDTWTSANDGSDYAVGDVTFTGTLVGGGTASETIEVNPTGNEGTDYEHLNFSETNLDGARLSELEIILDGSLNYIAIDNFKFNDISIIRYVANGGSDSSNDCLTSGSPCATITHAIDQAIAGDTVQVDGGTYNESINLNKNVTLEHSNTGGGNNWASIQSVTISNGTLNAPSGQFSIANDFSFTGGAFNHNNGTVIFNGGTTQNLTANSSLAFNNLTINSGTTLVESTAADNVTVGGTLTNNGTIRKTQSIAATGSKTFGLTAAEVNVTTQGSLTSLQVDRIDSNHPNANSYTQTGKYWTFTPNAGGYTLNMTLPYGSADTNDKVCRHDGGGTWSCAADSFVANTSVTRNDVSQLSDWAVGDDVPTAPDLTITKTVDDDTPNPGQLITYTITITNSGGASATNALISDTLSNGLTFAGPVTLEGTGGTVAQDENDLPTLASGLTITNGTSITVTFPVTVDSGVALCTVLTNTAAVTSTEVIAPQTDAVGLMAYPGNEVINTNDSGCGSLRQAILDAESNAGADEIVFNPGVTGTITLASALFTITQNLTITGPGADVLAISGDDSYRVFHITGGAVTISGLTITRGYPDPELDAGYSGGGFYIASPAVVTITNCAITHNTLPSPGALPPYPAGAGIYSDGDLTLERCTLSDNDADENAGGGVTSTRPPFCPLRTARSAATAPIGAEASTSMPLPRISTTPP